MLKVEVLTLETMMVPSVIPGIAKVLQNSPGVKMKKLNILDCNIVPVCFTYHEHLVLSYLYLHQTIIEKTMSFTFLSNLD